MMTLFSGRRLRRDWRLALAIAGVCAPLASPALAACPPGWSDNYCYSVTVQGAGVVPFESMPNYQHSYGATPQSAATPVSDIAGWASAAASDANNGTLVVRSVAGSYGYMSYADADLQYRFKLTPTDGAPTDAFVPLHVSAVAESLRDSQTALETATFLIQQDGSNLIYKSAGRPVDRVITMFTVDQWINVRPDDFLTVFMYASSQAIGGRDYGRVSSGVYIDPTFEIAPEYASRYTLVGLPLGDTTAPGAVPEPATWAMMVGGFGLAGTMVRRRRRDAQTA